MTRTASADGGIAPDIQRQIEARMAANPDVAAAREVAPGVVKDPDVVKERQREKARIASDRGKVEIARTDKKAEPLRERGSTFRENPEKGDAFVKAAQAAIEHDDARIGDVVSPENERSIKRGAMLREQPKAAPEAEPEVEQTEEEQAEAPAQESHGKPVEMDDEKATRLLRLDGFKTAALDKLSAEERIELASHRSKVRSGVEEMQRKLAQYEKQTSATPDKAPESATASPATSAPTLDIKALTKRFAAEYGDEAAAMTLEEPLTAVVKHMEDRMEERVSSFQPFIQTLVNLQIGIARDRLVRVYPELSEDSSFAKVRDRASKLDFNAYGGDIDAILSDAARLVLGSGEKGAAKEAARSARGRGQPNAGTRRTTSPPKSRHDAFGEIAAALEDGDMEAVDSYRRGL